MMSEKQFKELIEKLDALIKLTAVNALQGKPKAQGIRALSDLGLKPKEIAMILSTTPHTVSVVKSASKKAKKRQKAKSKTKTIEEKGGEQSDESEQGNISGNMG